MSYQQKPLMSRRTALAQAAGAAGLGAIFKMTEGHAAAQARGGGGGRGNVPYGAINKYSSPSDLRITDLQSVAIAGRYDYDIIRMDTNQGVYGLGEGNGILKAVADVREFVVGRNPLDITAILTELRLRTAHAEMRDAMSVLDMCLHDLVGKVFGVPAWRLLGDKKRGQIRIYCDTTGSNDPKVYAARLLERKKMGFTFFKMDIGTGLIRNKPGAINDHGVATTKGLQYYGELIQAVRDTIGWDVPIAADHFGGLDVSDAIRHARAFEPYDLAWAEDILQVGTLDRGPEPKNWRAYKQIQDATSTRLATGEANFGLEERFKDFIDNRAISVVHLDPQNCGGMREIKRIGDYANQTQGIPIATHMLGSPVMAFAAVHALATLDQFLAMEHHAVMSLPWWNTIVTGVSQPVVDKGYITVPDAPGLGIELNEPVVKQQLRLPGWFQSLTPANAPPRGNVESAAYPHFDPEGKWVVTNADR